MFEPPEKITRPLYHCGKDFVLEPLELMARTEEKARFGVAVIDGGECVLGEFCERATEEASAANVRILKVVKAHIPGRCRRGGMSALRTDRLRDEAEHAFVVHVAETCNNLFVDQENGSAAVQGLIFAGPADLKRLLGGCSALARSLAQRALGPVDLPRGGREGLRLAVAASALARQEAAAGPEGAAVDYIMDHILRGAGKVEVCYGLRETLTAAANGACAEVVASFPLAQKLGVPSSHAIAYGSGGSGGGVDSGSQSSKTFEDWLITTCKSFGTEVVWVGQRRTEAYCRFEGMGGFAARLRWPFDAAEEERFSSECCSLREAGSPQVTPSSVDEASVPSTTKVSAVDLKSELKGTSVTLLNPAAAEWVPN